MYTSANSFERVACILQFFIIVAISNEGSSFLYIQTKNFPLSVWKGAYDILCFHRGQKYGILPSFKVKFKKICRTCAARFQSSVKLLP